MARDFWDPDRYERFRDERERPFQDLLDMVTPVEGRDFARVLDLGCGTGKLTRVLHGRLGAEETIGVDSSAAMLARAVEGGGVSFVEADLADLPPALADARFDVVFSNAALQWVDGHERLLGRLALLLEPGGVLAVQVPANHDHAAHRLALELAGEAPFAAALDGFVLRAPVLSPERYAKVLDALGMNDIRVRLEVYSQRVADSNAVVEWVRGTLLTAFQARMSSDDFERFLGVYRRRLAELLPDRPLLYPFKRILFRARRAH